MWPPAKVNQQKGEGISRQGLVGFSETARAGKQAKEKRELLLRCDRKVGAAKTSRNKESVPAVCTKQGISDIC